MIWIEYVASSKNIFILVDHLSISSSEDRVDSVVDHPVGLSTRRKRMEAVLQQLTITGPTSSADQDGAEDDDEDDDNDAAAEHQKCKIGLSHKCRYWPVHPRSIFSALLKFHLHVMHVSNPKWAW